MIVHYYIHSPSFHHILVVEFWFMKPFITSSMWIMQAERFKAALALRRIVKICTALFTPTVNIQGTLHLIGFFDEVRSSRRIISDYNCV